MADNWYLHLSDSIRIMVRLARTAHSQTGMTVFQAGYPSPCILNPSLCPVSQAYHYNRSSWSGSEWGAGKDEWVDSWLPAIQFIKLLSEAMKKW